MQLSRSLPSLPPHAINTQTGHVQRYGWRLWDAGTANDTAHSMVLQPEPVAKDFNPSAEKKANSKLYQAQKLEKEGKVRLATKLYQEIIDQFPDTEAAKTAENKGTKVVDHRVDMAQEQLVHAEAFERINNFEEAKAEYEGVISRYPETEAAKAARSRLTNLKKK